jgi:hypothetical protein
VEELESIIEAEWILQNHENDNHQKKFVGGCPRNYNALKDYC